MSPFFDFSAVFLQHKEAKFEPMIISAAVAATLVTLSIDSELINKYNTDIIIFHYYLFLLAVLMYFSGTDENLKIGSTKWMCF